MNNTAVIITYRELQEQLSEFKAKGLTKIKLNSSKCVLEKEYRRLTQDVDKSEVLESTSLKDKKEELIAEYNAIANSAANTKDVSALNTLWDLRKKIDIQIKEIDRQIKERHILDLTTYSPVRQERLVKALKEDAENHDEQLNIAQLLTAQMDKITKLWTFFYLNSDNSRRKYEISNRVLEFLIDKIKTEEIPIYPDWVADAYKEFESRISVPTNWIKKVVEINRDIKITLISPNKQANVIRFNRYLNVTDAQITNGYVSLNGETKHIGSVFKDVQKIIKEQSVLV
jgi:hypothetical protein